MVNEVKIDFVRKTLIFIKKFILTFFVTWLTNFSKVLEFRKQNHRLLYIKADEDVKEMDLSQKPK